MEWMCAPCFEQMYTTQVKVKTEWELGEWLCLMWKVMKLHVSIHDGNSVCSLSTLRHRRICNKVYYTRVQTNGQNSKTKFLHELLDQPWPPLMVHIVVILVVEEAVVELVVVASTSISCSSCLTLSLIDMQGTQLVSFMAVDAGKPYV